MTRIRLAGQVAAATAGLLLVGGGAATADVGVGIGAAPITLAGAAEPGESYPIGPVTIVNTGTEPTTITIRVDADPTSGASAVPVGWIEFDDTAIDLAGGEQAYVGMQLNLPADAEPGSYQSLVYAGLTSPADVGGSQVGAEAATQLSFTVAGSTGGFSWTSPIVLAIGALTALFVTVFAAATRSGRLRRRVDGLAVSGDRIEKV